MEIVSLKIKNFLSISDAEIRPGKVTQIIGKNNQGKTSILRALGFAARGASDPSLIRKGADEAEVIVEIGDVTVRRRINAAGKQSVDVRKGEFKAPTPQAMLDALFADSAFNPLDLLDPKRRHDAIMQSIALKVTPERLAQELGVPADKLPPLEYDQHGLKVIDQAHKFYFQRRAEANKDAAEKRSRWETYSKDLPPEAPPFASREQVEKSITNLRATLANAEKQVALVAERNASGQARLKMLDDGCRALDKLKAERQELANRMSVLDARIEEGEKYCAMLKDDAPETLEDDAPARERVAKIREEIHQAEGMLNEVEKLEAQEKQREMVASMYREYESALEVSEKLTKHVDALRDEVKRQLMAEAEMPVAGLEYVDGKFLVDGVPVDNLSTSKALRLAVGVARKLAGKAKLICIDGAEALDADTYEALRQEISGDDGFTYFITKVGDSFPADPERGDAVLTMHEGQVVQ